MTTAIVDPSRSLGSSALNVPRSDRTVWLITVAIVAAIFLSLENPYWVPGGDSEVYVATARNLALGQGYLFNGQAARIAPPGWPLLLAAVMRFISPTFLAMKLLTLACMLGGLATYWWVIRRFVSPKFASGIILLTAIISHVYSLTFWLHSDSLFVLLTAFTLLLAMQISEGRRQSWRIILALALCALGTFVRWAGVINVLIVVAALLRDEWKPRRARVWLTASLVPIVTFSSFFVIRWGMKHFAPPRVPAEATAILDPSAQLSDVQVEDNRETQEPRLITGTGKGNTGYLSRFIGFGTWYSFLLWQPFRMAIGWDAIWWLATATGWVVIGIVGIACLEAARKRQWLLPATLLYTFALDLNWPHATARYLVPLTPLILVAIIQGISLLSKRSLRELLRWKTTLPQLEPSGEVQRRKASRTQRRFFRATGFVGIASVALCNLVLFGIDLWVMRSHRFYDRYEAGLDKSLIAIGQFLSDSHVGNWQVCVNPEYVNINKRRLSPTGLRMLTMLTGKATLQLPRKFIDSAIKLPRDRDFRDWIGRGRVQFYLEQPPISPWRVWHFRMGWLQKLKTGEDPPDTGAGWQLYRCDGRQVPLPVDVPQMKRLPTRVLGM